MQLDNDPAVTNSEVFDGEDGDTGAECKWLLEQDMSDPVEQLFSLQDEDLPDLELSEAEAEMAGRPMFRGHGEGDDISALFAEDIVAVDVGSGTDIYGDADLSAEDRQDQDQSLWVDHAKRSSVSPVDDAKGIADGTDIFALSDSDDIGETFLTLVSAKDKPSQSAATTHVIPKPSSKQEKMVDAGHGGENEAVKFASENDISVDLSNELNTAMATQESADSDHTFNLDFKQPDETPAQLDDAAGFQFGDELDLGNYSDANDESGIEHTPVNELSLDGELEFDHEASGGFDLGAITELSVESDLDLDLEDDHGYGSALELQADTDFDSEAIPEFDLTMDTQLGLESDIDLMADLDDGFDLEAIADFEIEIDADGKHSFGSDLVLDDIPGFEGETPPDIDREVEAATTVALDTDKTLEIAEDHSAASTEVDSDSGHFNGVLPTQRQAETVQDYVVNTPAPSDDAEFDEYLLKGDHLQTTPSHDEPLVVESTQGVASVDPALDQDIDYHEDFESMDGFQDGTVSAITGVISQVMFELTSAVEKRLSGFEVDSEAIVIDVLLGNDVNSIIQCVADGYLPIIDIQPQLPAALRQLGQSEVDAIYVRLSHPHIKADWNQLFSDNFALCVVSDTDDTANKIEEPEPFAALDLDEFDFDSETSSGDNTLNLDFEENLSEISEFSSDDPLQSIEFSAVVELPEQAGDVAEPASDPEDVSAAAAVAPVAETQTQALHWCVPADIRFNTTSGTGEIFTDFLDAFIEEATAEFEKLEDAIAAWETQSTSQVVTVPEVVTHTLHTVKGIAKGVGLQRFGTLIHNYETLLDALTMPVVEAESCDYFRTVNAWLDAVMQGFEFIETTRSDVLSELPVEPAEKASVGEQATPPVEPAIEPTIEDASQSIVANAEISTRSKPKSALLDAPAAKYIGEQQTEQQLADEGAKALAGQQSIRMSAEAMDNLLNLTNQAQQLGVRSSESTVRSKLAATELLGRLPSVRAHIARIADRALSNVTAKGETSGSALDALEMDQYSELQEAANILRESVEDLDDLVNLSSRQASTAEALLKQQAAVISSLGSSIQAARVIPVSRLIPGLRRIVRTVGTDLGKSVALKVLNQVGTLDRDNHARCQVILEHMVRNAMDHGIEAPQERLNQGKPASGTITIDVKKHGADYIISLSDDGRGVDPAVMRKTAYHKGLDVDVDALTDDESIQLIFHKGFSTAAQVSEISGRGVGMDIVLSELKQIGGDIEIESVVGEGTQFHIRIPPNVSVNGALLVAAGERSYAIPLDGLIAVDNVDVDVFFDAVADKRTLSLYGMECEPAYLATLCQGNRLPEPAAWNNTVPVMIAGSEDRYMAIAVDDVKQALELVIRSLGVQFSNVAGVAGATTTVDGQAVVALDLNALVDSVEVGHYTNVEATPEPEENLLVLVVDDSRTQRMVSTSQFDTLGVETITAENGMVAIDLLNTTHRLPDVILLDVEMPVKDGIQTLREIRKSVRYSDIPVIMVTSRTGAKHRALADEAGCNGYMGKPFNFPVLVEKIGELTGYNLQLN